MLRWANLLLKQKSLPGTAITHLPRADAAPFLGSAELMRLVLSQQPLLRREAEQRRRCRPTGAGSPPLQR
jgi:hypothetical protein